jgi:DNA-binding transcriptional regulator YbjK
MKLYECMTLLHTASMARATLSQDRSRQRRDGLLDAAIALFAEGGEQAITHRAVAARAGVAPATTTYYFGSIQALVEEALSRHVETWLRDLRALASMPAPPAGLLDAPGLTDLIAAAFALRTTEVVHTQLAVYLAASRSEGLRPLAAEALGEFEALAARVLAGYGVREPDVVAGSVVAVIGGSALRRLSGRYDDHAEAAALLRLLRAVLVTAVMDEDEVSTRLRALVRESRHDP